MPFGLWDALATFWRLTENLHWRTCLVYLNVFILSGKTYEDMLNDLEEVFDRLEKALLKPKAKIYQLFSKKVNYLEHAFFLNCWSQQTIQRSLLSMANKMKYSWTLFLCVTLQLLLCKAHKAFTPSGRQFVWISECENAFVLLKSAPILAMPNFEKPFTLDTDASAYAFGDVISVINGKEQPIALIFCLYRLVKKWK